MNILDRLHQYMSLRNLSFNKLEISIGASHGSISNAWKNKKNVGSQVIEKILNTYPEVRAEWLLRGVGPMILKNVEKETQTIADLDEIDMNQLLIKESLRYFKVETKRELFEIFSQTHSSFEETILATWESKYGKELKSINRRLMTLFTSKLSSEMNSEGDIKDSKTG